jgi:hypothetical protein
VRAHEQYIAGEVLASSLALGDGAEGVTVEVGGHPLRIAVSRS